MQQVKEGDLVLIELMIRVDDEGMEKVILKSLSEIEDNVAHFHEIVKPAQPEYQNLLEQWKKGVELKRKVREAVNGSVGEAGNN